MENKQLQEEAEKYEALSEYSKYEIRDAYITGTTSKYVEQEKLKFAIEQFKNALEWANDSNEEFKSRLTCYIESELKDLEQQLKELEK